MKRAVSIDGSAGSLQAEGSRLRYQRDGGDAIERDFSIAAAGPGIFSVIIEGRCFRIAAGPRGEITVNGQRLQVEVFDPRDARARATSASATGRQSVSAPMPGKVVRVLVASGDTVEEGQGLAVVEAMKMQNEMKSPKSGRVVEVRVKPNDTVSAGDVLIVVE